MTTYCTLEDVKRYIDTDRADDDALLNELIARASGASTPTANACLWPSRRRASLTPSGRWMGACWCWMMTC